MSLPNYNAALFKSKEEHISALHQACSTIVNAYYSTDILDNYCHDQVSPYSFMSFARSVMEHLERDK